MIASNSVIGLQVETPVSTEKARVEDEVIARVTRDVRVGDRVAIPAGSKAHGEVTLVEKGGRLKDRARLGVRFTSIVLADGTTVPITTETIYREGESPTGSSTAKIGGAAIGGAILGGILGGGKGAAIGGAIGAGGGSAAVMAGGPKDATLSSGSPVTVRLGAGDRHCGEGIGSTHALPELPTIQGRGRNESGPAVSPACFTYAVVGPASRRTAGSFDEQRGNMPPRWTATNSSATVTRWSSGLRIISIIPSATRVVTSPPGRRPHCPSAFGACRRAAVRDHLRRR